VAGSTQRDRSERSSTDKPFRAKSVLLAVLAPAGLQVLFLLSPAAAQPPTPVPEAVAAPTPEAVASPLPVAFAVGFRRGRQADARDD